jgi:hypothetical protein
MAKKFDEKEKPTEVSEEVKPTVSEISGDKKEKEKPKEKPKEEKQKESKIDYLSFCNSLGDNHLFAIDFMKALCHKKGISNDLKEREEWEKIYIDALNK